MGWDLASLSTSPGDVSVLMDWVEQAGCLYWIIGCLFVYCLVAPGLLLCQALPEDVYKEDGGGGER